MPRVTSLRINSVWSSYGHTFMQSGETEYDNDMNVIGYYVDCLTCGGHYVLRATRASHPDEFSDGAYVSNAGDAPMYCTRDTSMIHGDPGQNGHSLDCAEGCEHCTHECNCILCDN